MTARAEAAVLPITLLPARGLPLVALVVGDPARAERIAGGLDGAERVSANREYVTWRGTWDGSNVLVASHGVGAPGAMCLFHELLDAGVTTILRLGTAGAMDPALRTGDLVVAEAAVREDGVTDQVVPVAYPAHSAPEAVLALEAAARARDVATRRGIVWTRALFHVGHVPMPSAAYTACGVVAIEMELSALLVLASTRGATAGGILVIDGVNADDAPYQPHTEALADGVQRATEVALDALVALARGADL